MNLYDKQIVRCVRCKKQLGEIDLDSKIVFSVCKKCDSGNSLSQFSRIQKPKNFNFLNKRMIESEIS